MERQLKFEYNWHACTEPMDSVRNEWLIKLERPISSPGPAPSPLGAAPTAPHYMGLPPQPNLVPCHPCIPPSSYLIISTLSSPRLTPLAPEQRYPQRATHLDDLAPWHALFHTED